MNVRWQDLLAVPFEHGGEDPDWALDCYGQAKVINARAGHPINDDAREASGLKRIGDRWSDVRLQVGDLLINDPEERGVMSHVSTVVDPSRPLVLSCSENHGPYACAAWMVQDLIGVYRVSSTTGSGAAS